MGLSSMGPIPANLDISVAREFGARWAISVTAT